MSQTAAAAAAAAAYAIGLLAAGERVVCS